MTVLLVIPTRLLQCPPQIGTTIRFADYSTPHHNKPVRSLLNYASQQPAWEPLLPWYFDNLDYLLTNPFESQIGINFALWKWHVPTEAPVDIRFQWQASSTPFTPTDHSDRPTYLRRVVIGAICTLPAHSCTSHQNLQWFPSMRECWSRSSLKSRHEFFIRNPVRISLPLKKCYLRSGVIQFAVQMALNSCSFSLSDFSESFIWTIICKFCRWNDFLILSMIVAHRALLISPFILMPYIVCDTKLWISSQNRQPPL